MTAFGTLVFFGVLWFRILSGGDHLSNLAHTASEHDMGYPGESLGVR